MYIGCYLYAAASTPRFFWSGVWNWEKVYRTYGCGRCSFRDRCVNVQAAPSLIVETAPYGVDKADYALLFGAADGAERDWS